MFEGLVFGWRTAVLSVAAAVVLPIALGLFNAFHGRLAARTMAMALLVLVGVFTPWLIGFAGAYDKWRWLTFLPVANPLWAPPLLFLYVHALVHGRWPDRAWRHLLPGAAQFLWQAAAFALPLDLKNAWADASMPVTGPLFTAALGLSFVAYGWMTVRLLETQRGVLAQQRSDDARFALRWLNQALAAGALLAAFWTVYGVWDAIAPLGYQGLMGLYVGLAAIAVYLAVESWRQTRVAYPVLDALPTPPVQATGRDWAAQGQAWAARVRAEDWFAEPELSLSTLAARLGTNTAYLSRAINDGLGVNFSTFINGLRSEAVAARIEAGAQASLLTLALDAGFSSKASFNRAFLSRFGQTPQAYRAAIARGLKS
ncbi:AraC family transcriptional regulator [Brevundimonas sp. Leaf363]|uniref:helix-turn-helix domain-containing protein n=1 Tax=Brevundimonas sp. Leaf363 TaxID=1736353 RepID=UPI000A6D0011|nr:AraC family transcriptional regulator [Brevundimonas sp. Leaf363]